MNKYREHMDRVRRERLAAHNAQREEQARLNAEQSAADAERVRRLDERTAAGRLDGKAATGPAENKARQPVAENKGAGLEDMTVPELEQLAEERGVTARGTGSGGRVLKADLLRALR